MSFLLEPDIDELFRNLYAKIVSEKSISYAFNLLFKCLNSAMYSFIISEDLLFIDADFVFSATKC